MKYWRSSLILVVFNLVLTACSIGADRFETNRETDTLAASRFIEYRIGPSDVLTILVWQQPEMTRKVTVRPDGMISFPLLGDIAVTGLTPLELRDALVFGLREYLDTLPEEVSVVVEETNSYTVSVLGEVNAAGNFAVKGPLTVLDALALAGGMTEFAASSKIVILRNEDGVMQRIPFDYGDIRSSRLSVDGMTIYPGDIVVVP